MTGQTIQILLGRHPAAGPCPVRLELTTANGLQNLVQLTQRTALKISRPYPSELWLWPSVLWYPQRALGVVHACLGAPAQRGNLHAVAAHL